MKALKPVKNVRPRQATRENAIKAAEYCRDLSLLPGRGYGSKMFNAKWFEEQWLYGGSGGKAVLDGLVAEGVLRQVWGDNYELV